MDSAPAEDRALSVLPSMTSKPDVPSVAAFEMGQPQSDLPEMTMEAAAPQNGALARSLAIDIVRRASSSSLVPVADGPVDDVAQMHKDLSGMVHLISRCTHHTDIDVGGTTYACNNVLAVGVVILSLYCLVVILVCFGLLYLGVPECQHEQPK